MHIRSIVELCRGQAGHDERIVLDICTKIKKKIPCLIDYFQSYITET